jgi:hypothetical protein
MPDEEPLDPRDKRSAARAKRRADSLYEGLDDAERARLEHVSTTRTSNYRWAPGEDPHDLEATPDSGWEYKKLEVVEGESDIDTFKGVRGPDSGVRCFRCKAQHYLIIDERTREQVLADRDVESWAIQNNRPVDPLRQDPEKMLWCPGCRHTVQVMDYALKVLQEQEAKRDH